MSERKQIIPQYGPFAGMRVIDSGSLIAMPYAATLLADFGAEVIHIERPGVGDTLRVLAPFAKEDGKTVSTSWAQDGRNKLSLSLELNLKHPEVKELFFGLIKEADVFMENMVWLEKLGIRDEELLEVNPKLIIAHISGYGNPRFGGLPEYCDRASYDMIGQAFSGWMGLNGEKGGEPVVGKPWLNDFTSAYAAVFAVLAAYINVLKGGDGQIVDIAQFEVQASYCCDLYTSYTMAGRENTRSGNKSAAFQPYGLFKSKDGYDVALGAFGPGVYKRAIQAMNLDLEYFNYKVSKPSPPRRAENSTQRPSNGAQPAPHRRLRTQWRSSRSRAAVSWAQRTASQTSIIRSATTSSSTRIRRSARKSLHSASSPRCPAPRVRSGAALRASARTRTRSSRSCSAMMTPRSQT